VSQGSPAHQCCWCKPQQGVGQTQLQLQPRGVYCCWLMCCSSTTGVGLYALGCLSVCMHWGLHCSRQRSKGSRAVQAVCCRLCSADVRAAHWISARPCSLLPMHTWGPPAKCVCCLALTALDAFPCRLLLCQKPLSQLAWTCCWTCMEMRRYQQT
jgi:hypothetical protein